MKRLLFTAVITQISLCVIAQTPLVGVLKNQTDAWGLSYTYIGEIKNGKPNGMGVAKYSSGNVKRYVGSFVNGVYSGRGTMLFTNGEFLTGSWTNNKINGKGTNLTSDGTFYVGDFKNGVKSGEGIMIYKNNGFMIGEFADDKLNGRCINLWADGNIISDNIYVDDKRNGSGFQYEAASKKLYEGEWRDDKWVQATTASFASFLQHPDFTGESNTSHILMGPVTSRGYLKDTSFFYDLSQHKRYFGYYTEGKLDEGVLIGDDSTRFIGALDDNGAKGYCYDFKFGSYYSEGNYTKDLLDGDILDINLKKNTVYYGQSIAGEFTGKAHFFNDRDAMYVGDYKNGSFTGEGYRIESNGRFIQGTWDDGKVVKATSIISSSGENINPSPKTFSEAMNIVVKDYTDYYDNISGGLSDDKDYLEWSAKLADDDYSDLYYSLIKFPGTAGDFIVTDFDSTNYYMTKFIETKDIAKAKAKYDEIAKQLQTCTITNKNFKTPVKLQGTIKPVSPASDKVVSKFDLGTTNQEYKNFHAWLVFDQDKNGDYSVTLEIGEKPED
jgi:hypothetical protein